MTVLAKFKCTSRSDGNGHSSVSLSAVTSGSPENDEFFKWTPTGHIALSTINPAAAEQFEVGALYFVEFVRANPAQVQA